MPALRVQIPQVLTVAMVVACQAATMFVALGWEFGAVEAISLILFVGFSVDYTLHFAEAFHVSPPPKIENALSRVGRAIISAGTTTGGSAAFFCCASTATGTLAATPASRTTSTRCGGCGW